MRKDCFLQGSYKIKGFVLDIVPMDIVFAVIILVAAVRCTFKGFIAEIMTMASIILAIGAALLFSGLLSGYLESIMGESVWNGVISFLIIFLVVYLIVKLLEGSLHKLIEKIELEKLDQALGFFLGVIEGILVITVFVLVLDIQPFFDTVALLKESFIASLLLKVLPVGSAAAVGEIR